MSMYRLKKLASESPFRVRARKGMVVLEFDPWKVKGFMYGVHDQCRESGIFLADEGRKFARKFCDLIGHTKERYSLEEAAEIITRSLPHFME